MGRYRFFCRVGMRFFDDEFRGVLCDKFAPRPFCGIGCHGVWTVCEKYPVGRWPSPAAGVGDDGRLCQPWPTAVCGYGHATIYSITVKQNGRTTMVPLRPEIGKCGASMALPRSEERRVGKEWISTGRSRGSQNQYKKKIDIK